ncbi:SMI1/KNR4 family protein [Actinomadura rugatobispora]|uniref:SMI1/KNR4 family protein n=1 Tax=Actinomadura rugatobispora TaxID=1994 RepID=A0ABW1AGX6_9ACTN
MADFEDVKLTFWAEDGYGVQSPLTEEAVGEAERELALRLPALLLDLLSVQNGGEVAEAWDAFPTDEPNSWSPDHVPFPDLLGIGRREGTLSLLDTPYLTQEWGLPSPVVLLSGDGHYWIALDYRASGVDREPSVTWLDADRGTELALAPDFRSFVEGLVPSGMFDDDFE